MYARTSTYLWWDDAGRRHEIAQAEGVEPGDPLAPGLYALGQHDSLVAASATLRAGEYLAAFLDDLYVVTVPERAAPLLRIVTGEVERSACVEANLGKTQVYNAAGGEALPGIAALGPDVWCGDLPPARRGFVALGVPIGHPDFVGAHAAGRLEAEADQLDKLQRLPDLQSAWFLSAYCAAPRAQHLLRNVPPADILPYARAHDAAIWNVVEGLLGGQGPDEGDAWLAARAVAFLPPSFGGLGLLSAERVSSAAYGPRGRTRCRSSAHATPKSGMLSKACLAVRALTRATPGLLPVRCVMQKLSGQATFITSFVRLQVADGCLLLLVKTRRVARYGKPLQYTLAVESFCLLEGIAALISFVNSQPSDDFGEEPSHKHWCFGSRRIRCIDNGVSGAASRPYLLQNFARIALPIAPQEPAAGLFLSGAARSALFAAGLFVLGAVRRPMQLHLGRLLLAASGAVKCVALLTVLKAALLLQFCFGCRLPAHSTVLGDVHGFTHSASGIPATASLPNSLAFLAATILANTLYSEVCANVPAGGGFHTQSVCVNGVSNAITSCLKSWPSKTWVRYSFDFFENGQMSCGDGSVRARKPLLQPPLTVWPFWGLRGRPFSEKLKGCALPLCFGCRLSALWHQAGNGGYDPWIQHSELRLKDSVTLRGRLFEVAQTWFYWTWLRRAGGAKIIQDVRAGYSATGLPPQRCSKRLRRRTLDGHLDGRAGILTPNAKRVVLLAFLLSDIVKRKACCGSLLDGGAVVSALQMRSIKKGMLSLFDAVYSEQRKNTEGFAEQMMAEASVGRDSPDADILDSQAATAALVKGGVNSDRMLFPRAIVSASALLILFDRLPAEMSERLPAACVLLFYSLG
ncbi:hypothetical protein AK812_SmicGene14193 [Symbiodinium microadriaticum]|uniref:Reverse transcriptase domain-containing protein n=1 Tax=Symbiodinium microadriaticum TaxID=2951 RepID=A0A1Q9E685_SYMMI|nr:hypothetical protein AK812_SmicGene14193 [Symbiodinium microadriaticum]